MELNLIMTQEVNNVPVNGYYGEEMAWFTRQQVGEALEYSEPMIAIGKIHNRRKERFEGKSVLTKLVYTDGKTYETWVYNFKGILEICRWSRQPKADMVMDALYDMAEQVMKKGYYSILPDEELARLIDERLNRTVGGKQKLRDQRTEQTLLLDLERNKISHEEYVMRLRCIWGEDSYGFHKAFDEYLSWYNQAGRRLQGVQS